MSTRFEPVEGSLFAPLEEGDLSINQNSTSPLGLAFHPNMPNLLFGLLDERRLAVWDRNREPEPIRVGGVGPKAESAILAERVCPHEVGWIQGFDISRDGTWLVTVGSDRTLRRWSLHTGLPEGEPEVRRGAHEDWVQDTAVSPDGRFVATAGADGVVKLWNPELEPVATFEGHPGTVRTVAWVGNSSLVSGCTGGELILWDPASPGSEPVHRVEHCKPIPHRQIGSGTGRWASGVRRLAVSHDGRLVAAADKDFVVLYESTSLRPLARVKANIEVVFHPRREVLFAGTGVVGAWDLTETELDPDAKKPRELKSALASFKRGAGQSGAGIALSKKGDVLALGNATGVIRLWNVEVGEDGARSSARVNPGVDR